MPIDSTNSVLYICPTDLYWYQYISTDIWVPFFPKTFFYWFLRILLSGETSCFGIFTANCLHALFYKKCLIRRVVTKKWVIEFLFVKYYVLFYFWHWALTVCLHFKYWFYSLFVSVKNIKIFLTSE